MRDYVDIAINYAEDVVNGRIVAGDLCKRACQRQLDDLRRTDFPYVFDADKATRVCKFVELMPHVKGKWANKRIVLEPWQVFRISTAFGWVNDEGIRRFKTAYGEVARKNAKSTETSAVALYALCADGEAGAEVYSGATTREQAGIVWKDAKAMVQKTPQLREKFGVNVSAHSIHVEQTGSFFRTLSRDQGGNHDGLNIHFAAIDELHAHKTRDLYDVIETATGARQQPMMWIITTAGSNMAGICYEIRSYAVRVLMGEANGGITDDEFFTVIYTIDEGDEWTDESVWIKANPNLGVSCGLEDLRRKARKAQQVASAQNNFLTKHLNCWVNADTSWLNMKDWTRCANPDMTIEDFEGEDCHVTADLATKKDLCAVAVVFRRDDRYIPFVFHFLPEEAIEDGRNSQYEGWREEGRLIETPGNVIDMEYIEELIREIATRFNVLSFAYDPWQSQYLANNLSKDGMNCVEFRQTVANVSEPMKVMEASVMSGKFEHSGCPVLTWEVSNVVCHTDAKENIYPRKERKENKIDGVVAVIMGIGRWLVDEQATKGSYLERADLVVL